MSRFIKANELADMILDKSFKTTYDNNGGVRYEDIEIKGMDVLRMIDECKQYEFEEPPKKAKWLKTSDDNKKRCSNCDFIFMIATYPICSVDFCPHCGAKMEKCEEERDE